MKYLVGVLFLLCATAVFGQNDATNDLIRAITYDSPEKVKLALASGADYEFFDYENGPLIHFAAAKGNMEILQALVEAGAKVSSLGPYGEPLAFSAAKSENPQVLVFLAEHGVDLNATFQNKTLLSSVAEKGSLDKVKSVLALGVNPTAKNDVGATALDSALEFNEDLRVVKLLFTKCLDKKDIPGTVSVLAVFHRAGMENRQTLEILKMFFDGGLSAKVLNRARVPVINTAVWPDAEKEVIDYLLAKGLDPNIPGTYMKTTPLMTLAQHDASTAWAIPALLKAGANPNLEDDTGRTALDYLDQNRYLKTSTVRKTLKDAMKK